MRQCSTLRGRPFSEVLDRLDLTPRELREVRTFGEELPEEAVGVLIGAPLPGTLRMREVDREARRLSEEPVLGQLLTAVVVTLPHSLGHL